MIGLTDVVASFCSTEQVFRPDLRNTALIVCSSNDGSIISATQEALDLGIKKFKPLYQYKELIQRHNIHVYSSNYVLIGQMSQKVMSVIASLSPLMNQYSVDEAFSLFEGCTFDLRERGRLIVDKVQKETGMPVRFGCAINKTLSKVANTIAKRVPRANGVVVIDDDDQRIRILAKYPIIQVWGVGKSIAKGLEHMGIYTALDLAQADKKTLRSRFSVMVERTARELNSEKCFPFFDDPPLSNQIISSKSFGKKITDVGALMARANEYLVIAMGRLRSKGLMTSTVLISGYGPFGKEYVGAFNKVVGLATPTTDTLMLAPLVSEAVKQGFKPGASYAKIVITLTELVKEASYQPDMFSKPQSESSISLIKTIDSINYINSSTIQLGRSLVAKETRMKQERLSPNYLGSWLDIPIIKCN